MKTIVLLLIAVTSGCAAWDKLATACPGYGCPDQPEPDPTDVKLMRRAARDLVCSPEKLAIEEQGDEAKVAGCGQQLYYVFDESAHDWRIDSPLQTLPAATASSTPMR